jgi:hypothetical protein
MLVNGQEIIRLNVSNTFYNKENTSGQKKAFSFSFYPVEYRLTELVNHIVTGKAFTVGRFVDNRRVEERFVSSQLLALDLDQCPLSIEELEYHSFIQEYAFLMYPTPSSTPEQPKTRVLFVLDNPIEGDKAASRWRVLQIALMEHFSELAPDDACKDPARLFYGCDTRAYYLNYTARLDSGMAGHLALPHAEAENFSRTAAQYVVTRQRDSGDELSRLVGKWLDTAYQRVSNTAAGDRHKTFIRYALWLYGLNAGGWPLTTQDIERLFLSINAAWGGVEADAMNSLKWAQAHSSPIGTEEHRVSVRGKRVTLLERMRQWQHD